MATFGIDISTPDAADLDPYFGTVSGWRALAQAIGRRLITPRGSLIDDAAYGFDVRSRLNGALTPSDLATMAAFVKREAEADERVERADVTVSFASGALTVKLILTTGDGPFRLVLAVSAVTTEILAAEPV